MHWDDVTAAARATGTIAYVGTVGADDRPHVAVVSPGFGEGTVWFATRRGTRKLVNLATNHHVTFHWPVGGEGPGELFLRGIATIHDSSDARGRLWTEANLPYDPSGFFGSPDNPDVVFVEVAVSFARLLSPGFTRTTWAPDPPVG